MGFLAETEKTVLDNGFRIYNFFRPGPMVELQIWVNTGSIHENEFLGCGLSHFLEHMLFQGSANYPGNSITDAVNAMGGELNAFTSYDHTTYRFQLPQAHWAKGVEMLSAMVTAPELPEARFLAEREVILRECERGMDSVSRRVIEEFMRTMFLKHPLRYPIIGCKEMISGVTREMALEYHRRRYTPERSFAVVVGPCVACEVADKFAAALGSWQRHDLLEAVLPREIFSGMRRNSEVIFPDPLSRLMWGIQAPAYGDRDLPALEVLMGMLGTGDGSLLGNALVLEKELALDVSSFTTMIGGEVLCALSMECEKAKFPAARRFFYRELASALSGKITAKAAAREKMQQYADRLRSLKDPVNIAGEIGGSVLYTGTPDSSDSYLKRLLEVSVEDIRMAAAKYIKPDSGVEVVQLPEKEKRVRRLKPQDKVCEVNCGTSAAGIRYLHVPDRRLPMCNFSLVLPGGGLFEIAGKRGISSLCAKLATAGGSKFTESQILHKLDEYGVDLGVSAGANSLIVDFSVPKRKFVSAVGFLADVLQDAGMNGRAFEREKNTLLETLMVRAQQPFKKAVDLADGILYGEHPYASRGRGVAADIAALQVEEVQQFYRRLWQPERTVVGFGGDCSAQDAEKLANLFTGSVSWDREAAVTMPELPLFPTSIVRKNCTLPREQTVALRMLPGAAVSANRKTADALDILYHMENGLGSQLFKSVREKHALSYAVGMNLTSGFHPGTIFFYAMTARDAGDRVLALIEDEISRLGEGKFSAAEFEAARSGAVVDADKAADNPDVLLRNALLDSYYGFDPAAIACRREELASLTIESFGSELADYLSRDRAGAAVLILPGNEA